MCVAHHTLRSLNLARMAHEGCEWTYLHGVANVFEKYAVHATTAEKKGATSWQKSWMDMEETEWMWNGREREMEKERAKMEREKEWKLERERERDRERKSKQDT